MNNVPIPPRKMLIQAVEDYNEHQMLIANYDIVEAIEWLIAEMPYRPFAEQMQKQYDYFTTHKLGR